MNAAGPCGKHHPVAERVPFSYLSVEQPLTMAPAELFAGLTRGGRSTNVALLESGDPGAARAEKSVLLTRAALSIQLSRNAMSMRALSDNGAYLVRHLAAMLQRPRIAAGYGIGRSELVNTSRNTAVDTSSRSTDPTLNLELSTRLPEIDEFKRLLAPSALSPLRLLLDSVAADDTQSARAFALTGAFAFDLVQCFETLTAYDPPHATDSLLHLLLPEQRIVCDHLHGRMRIEQLAFDEFECRDLYHDASRAVAVLAQQSNDLQHHYSSQLNPVLVEGSPVPAAESGCDVDLSDADFKAMVRRCQEHIMLGDIFQIVPSRCFKIACQEPFAAYQALCRANSSPYQFYFNLDGLLLFGASPESAVRVDATTGQVDLYPIAGTAARGLSAAGEIDLDQDNRNECSLRLDKKEQAEHLMLVDLARNDIARIAQPGSRHVARLLELDKYSHVMHLVSQVVGRLRPELDALHAYQACANMGTLSGAPKIKATELLRQLEGRSRGFYGGAVGYVDAAGSMDTAIVIRSAEVIDGVAMVRAGAGVVADSDPQAEADETRQKAAAVIEAIDRSNRASTAGLEAPLESGT